MPSNYDMGKLVSDVPQLNKRRSFIPNLSTHSQFDCNAGLLVPMSAPIEILPGDTFKVKHALKIRMSNPPKVPVMDTLVCDMYWFYCPNRVVWDSFDSFISGDVGTHWENLSTQTTPKVRFTGLFPQGSLFDFLGAYQSVAGGVDGYVAFPFRMYQAIWNYYFRFEPLQTEIYYAKDSTLYTIAGPTLQTHVGYYYDPSHFSDYYDAVIAGEPLLAPVNKLPGYFERALPMPQAGPSPEILGFGDVVLGSSTDPIEYTGSSAQINGTLGSFKTSGFGSTKGTLIGIDSSDFSEKGTLYSLGGPLSGISGNNINDLRTAFSLDHLLHLDAIYGRKINGYTLGHFGVNVPDYRVDQPEFLMHKRIYIGVNQVIQSSSSVENSPQGNVGAWSESVDVGFDFIKSFCEHGFIMPLCCIRILNHTYSQGTNRFWKRDTRLDYYDPVFANISDTPIRTCEIYNAEGISANAVFGYQESWAEYKYIPNHVANHMRPQASNTLAIWNYADYYSSRPYLDALWLLEGCTPIDRTMNLTSSADVSQFIVDVFWNIGAYRRMPLHSIPGQLTNSW